MPISCGRGAISPAIWPLDATVEEAGHGQVDAVQIVRAGLDQPVEVGEAA